MIKINLAARKGSVVSASAPADTTAGGGTSGGSMASMTLQGQLNRLRELQFSPQQFGELRDLPIKRLLGVVLIAFVANYLSTSFQDDEIRKLDEQVKKLQDQQKLLKTELDNTKGFEAIRKSLEADELTMKTKIEVINKLLSDRQKPPKLLLGLSSIIPPDVWLSTFNLTETDVKLTGFAMNQLLVPEFQKNLGESADFKDVQLLGQNIVLDAGNEIVRFDLTAKRK